MRFVYLLPILAMVFGVDIVTSEQPDRRHLSAKPKSPKPPKGPKSAKAKGMRAFAKKPKKSKSKSTAIDVSQR